MLEMVISLASLCIEGNKFEVKHAKNHMKPD